MSLLHSLHTSTKSSKKRVGRGYGSGKGGHTSAKGQKGQRSRGSSKIPVWFEGGQLPLVKRLPMIRGKGRLKSLASIQTLQLSQVAKLPIETISVASLKEVGAVRRQVKTVKIVGTAQLDKKLTVQDVRLSKTAQETIEKAGGRIG